MSKWKMVPVEPTDQMIRAIDGLICSSYLWPVYAYRAMLDAAPVPVGDDCDDILDCYAAESQQFSDEIVSLRASVESARTKAIALESRRDAWRDSAILSQRSASELARQVDQQAAELARLRAENERLNGALDNVRLLAGRAAYRNEGWSIKLRQFCADAGVTGSPFRAPTAPLAR